MDCSVQSAMLSVSPGGDPTPSPQPASAALTTAVFTSTEADQAQFEADKRAVYKHPLFPLLALLFERCELATQSSDPQSSDAFNLDIQAFVQHQERDRKPFLANEPEIDGLMIKAIQVLRIHLLELEKVQELCKDFCNRYITCLKGKMQSENLLRSDYPQDVLGSGILNSLENNNNNMMSHANSDSGSASNSPVQYAISPSSQNASQPPGGGAPTPDRPLEPLYPPYAAPTASLVTTLPPEGLVVHGSTPLSAIGAGMCPLPPPSEHSGPLSPAPTTPGGSEDCDSDIGGSGGGGRGGGRRQKRGVLPKQATSVMRSWLFQHLVHPYPTEDEKRHIAAQTNLTLLQVNNWFINARRRILQPMLDASAPSDGTGQHAATSPSHKRKKTSAGNNNRRFWAQDFSGVPAQMDSAGLLSSSEDSGSSYSSDGEEGGGLVIDAGATHAGEPVTQNGHPPGEPLAYEDSPPDPVAASRQCH